MSECNCIQEAQDSIKKMLIEKGQNIKGYEVDNVFFKHLSYFPKHRLYSTIEYKESFEKKDGSQSIPKKKDIAVFYSYCPFCGKSLLDKPEMEIVDGKN